MTSTYPRPDQSRAETIDRPRRRTRVAVDAAGLVYVIAVYVAVVTRGRFYVRPFHDLARVALKDALHPGVAFMFALVGDVPVDIAAAIFVTLLMVCRNRRERV